jgi:hypothetical protein
MNPCMRELGVCVEKYIIRLHPVYTGGSCGFGVGIL